MRELAGRLAELDPDAGAALQVIAYFDRLMEGRVGLEALVRGAAVLSGCPVRLLDERRGVRIRVEPDGRREDPGGPVDPAWPWVPLDTSDGGRPWAALVAPGAAPLRAELDASGEAGSQGRVGAPEAGAGSALPGVPGAASGSASLGTPGGARLRAASATSGAAPEPAQTDTSGEDGSRGRVGTPEAGSDVASLGVPVAASDSASPGSPGAARLWAPPGTPGTAPEPAQLGTSGEAASQGRVGTREAAPATALPGAPDGAPASASLNASHAASPREPAGASGTDQASATADSPVAVTRTDAAVPEIVAALWLELPGPPDGVRAMILERAAGAVRAVLERTRGWAPPAAPAPDPALVEVVLDASAPQATRTHAAVQLGLKRGQSVRAVALPGGGAEIVPAGRTGIETRRAGVGPAVEVAELPRSWAAARTALRLTAEGTTHDPGPRTVYADELGGLALLAAAVGPDTPPIPDELAVERALAEASWAAATLHAVVSAPSLRAAATELTVHHSTLQERLIQAEHILGWDVHSPQGRLRLQLALAVRKLRRTGGVGRAPEGLSGGARQ